MKECKVCKGERYKYPNCDMCERMGWVDDPDDGGTMTCPDCDGESSEECEACEGTGEDLESEDSQ